MTGVVEVCEGIDDPIKIENNELPGLADVD